MNKKEANRYATTRIAAAWLKWKRTPGEEITQYDWGFKDGVDSCKALFADELRRPEEKNNGPKGKHEDCD